MVVICPDMVVSKVCGASATTQSPRVRLGAPLVPVASSIACFLHIRVDGKKGVGTNIIKLSRKADSVSEENLGVGRGCVSEENPNGCCALMLNYRSYCQRRLAIVALWASIGGLNMVGECPKKGRWSGS